MRTVAIWRSGELVGLAPFSEISLGPFRVFATAGAGYGFCGEPVIDVGDDESVESLLDVIAAEIAGGTAAFYLRRLRVGGPLMTALARRPDFAVQTMSPDEEHCVVRFDLMNDVEEYFASVRKKHKLDRRDRRLARDFESIVYRHEQDTDRALDGMRELMLRRFGHDLRIFRRPSDRALTYELAKVTCAAGTGRLSSLVLDGRRASVAMDLQIGSRVVAHAVAADHSLRQYSIGHIETFENLRTAHSRGVDEVDLGDGGFAYKRQWANETRRFRTVAIMSSDLPGRIAHHLRRATVRLHRSSGSNSDGGLGPHVV
jgi:CelD/BcsL family acetyltransferase involved in cellulose biosynthesis